MIGSDFGDCASLAVAAFFAGGVAGHPIQPCAPGANPFAPTPLTPTKLAYVHPVPGLSGRPSLTLTAVLDTIVDLNRQVVGATLQADAQLPSGSSFGGLRGGYAKLSTSKLALTRFTFIPGVELSGTFPVSKGQLQTTTLQITGSSAAHGIVRVGSGKQVTGTLGGKRFNVNIAKVKLSRAGDGGGRERSRMVLDAARLRRCRSSRGYAERVPNALALESSPYLRQHAHNPVDWLPWGPVALARAGAEDKPLLVSIGYSSCHWCHVMERESFEDQRTAALMNELFVCVKVDREERPDVDALYMEAVQSMTGHGGWPLNVFLTPEQLPFYGGTYFPPEPRHGMPAWTQVLQAIGEAWSERREEIRAGGEGLRERLSGGAGLKPSSEPLEQSALETAVANLRAAVRPGQRGIRRPAEVSPGLGDRVSPLPRRAGHGLANPARDGERRHPRPGGRRVRALQRRRDLDGAALREDALRQRAARARLPARVPALRRAPPGGGLPRHARLGAARDARTRGRLLLGARRRLGGRRGTLLRVDASASCATRSARTPRRRSRGSARPRRVTSSILTIPRRG